MTRSRMVVLVVAMLALGGCGALGPTPSPSMICNAFTLGSGAVAGTLRVTTEETWLEAADGSHLHVVWPQEVEIRPDGLHNRGTGRQMVRDGERLKLIQTAWDSASGTFADPYRPSWCSFYDVF